jgi:N-acetylmuramoyl-L-alanine amidase
VTPPTAPSLAAPAERTAPAALTIAEQEDESDPSPATSEEAGLLPQVTGIRHWSSAESSTVVIDIQDQVQYEAHRLPNPERIYFDLHDTTLAAGFSSRTIAVNDALLQRVRVGFFGEFGTASLPSGGRSPQTRNQTARPSEDRPFRSPESRSA